jgi:mycothiol synthase
VNTLGVRSAWRGHGIGQALLRLSFAEFQRRAVTMVKLFVDAANETGATRLYERAGMRVHRQYDVWEKEIMHNTCITTSGHSKEFNSTQRNSI